jgi:hypothetical protein
MILKQTYHSLLKNRQHSRTTRSGAQADTGSPLA